ncbi:uncharacterized protein LOC113343500 [Papaver somniferum]|uniref:uncharacterized protein LOC113343500 n=1 Tax=Papaver somniferum TaxID=3469 RepID=UPI000E6F5B8B|nr:uncharacterized protein LOC113343500 [Papaver somniferum]
MNDLGFLHYFLGIEATFDSTAKKLLLTQNKYSLELLKKHDMLGCKPCRTPVSQGHRASICDGTPLFDATSFRSMVGGLQYLTLTRLDIGYDVNYVRQFLQENDWAGCLDTRRSSSGYCMFVGDSLASWSSKKKFTISRSEAEYRGLANATTKILWLSYLFEEISVNLHLPCRTESFISDLIFVHSIQYNTTPKMDFSNSDSQQQLSFEFSVSNFS